MLLGSIVCATADMEYIILQIPENGFNPQDPDQITSILTKIENLEIVLNRLNVRVFCLRKKL